MHALESRRGGLPGGKGRQLSEASRKLVKIIKDSKHIRDNRSMVEEELDKLTTESGRLLSPDHVLDYLRLFKEATSGNAGQAMAAQGPQGQSSGGNSGSTRYSARDLSILCGTADAGWRWVRFTTAKWREDAQPHPMLALLAGIAQRYRRPASDLNVRPMHSTRRFIDRNKHQT